MARPTPISATSTVSSVTCWIWGRIAMGSRLSPSGIGSSPTPIPTKSSTIAAEMA